ncbi:hypothetical protein [Acetobacterium woodii]|uniref:Uncharacterized protein n=1 Tax=Acetobacterium woodii (strain ATCC 29683 / DSM 1030 / JCM 2381 / KCTC 1655 / WB1) TaxID=931626 RepID=H6LDD7_ACEWD|nr:hypothetical protein [Acetobacterium woodii]AFA47909.1 hypothetical protein Awo_c11250 [Acetobacterium woodii DSM 1030]
METRVLYLSVMAAILVVTLIGSLVGLKNTRLQAKTDWNGSYGHVEAVAKVGRNLSIFGLAFILLIVIVENNNSAFDLVYAQTNGYYITESGEDSEIDMINFIDQQVLEIINDGNSSKVTYEKVDPDHFKFSLNKNGDSQEYLGEVKKESDGYHITLINETDTIELKKSK